MISQPFIWSITARVRHKRTVNTPHIGAADQMGPNETWDGVSHVFILTVD